MSLLRPSSSMKLGRSLQTITRRGVATNYIHSPTGSSEPQRIPDANTMSNERDESTMLETRREHPNRIERFKPEHRPDYTAHVDHATSQYSPVPKVVQDGSEPGTTLSAAVLSGAPVDLQARVVRIYKPVKPATQSGSWGSHAWRMDWDPLPKGHRWENPLMGWQSSADPMQGTKLQFKTREEAIHFAEKQGYEFYVHEPQERRFVPKAYANNFLHEPGPLKHIKTK